VLSGSDLARGVLVVVKESLHNKTSTQYGSVDSREGHRVERADGWVDRAQDEIGGVRRLRGGRWCGERKSGGSDETRPSAIILSVPESGRRVTDHCEVKWWWVLG